MTRYSQYKLFAKPSFVEGMSRILDIGDTLQEYNASKTDSEADIKALRSDWKIVGADIKKAASRYEQEFAKV